MEEKTVSLPHTLLIDNRKKLVFTGITDVGSFNEESVNLETSLGSVNVTGENLQVTKLSLETGDVTVEGRVISLSYSNGLPKGGGLLAKVFG